MGIKKYLLISSQNIISCVINDIWKKQQQQITIILGNLKLICTLCEIKNTIVFFNTYCCNQH